MAVRLNKALKTLNVGINTVAEFLQRKGKALQDAAPNAKITEEQYVLLVNEFGEDSMISDEIRQNIQRKKERLQELYSKYSEGGYYVAIVKNIKPAIAEVLLDGEQLAYLHCSRIPVESFHIGDVLQVGMKIGVNIFKISEEGRISVELKEKLSPMIPTPQNPTKESDTSRVVIETNDTADRLDENRVCEVSMNYKDAYFNLMHDLLSTYDRFTPERIDRLSNGQIFVFGTDKYGSQRVGAAGAAHRLFGAAIGVSEGITGSCYAIPTKGFSKEEVCSALEKLVKYIREHKEQEFLITPVGCGHAGFETADIAPSFESCIGLCNVCLPESFVNFFSDKYLKQEKVPANNSAALTEKELVIGDRDDIKKSEVPLSDPAIPHQPLPDVVTVKKETPFDEVKRKETAVKESPKKESLVTNHSNFSDELHDIIEYLDSNGKKYNKKESFTIKDRSNNDRIIAEAELCVFDDKIIINPVNSVSERIFENMGYIIMDPEEFLDSINEKN